MAERVAKSLENFLKDAEFMVREKLFTEDEMRTIVKKRTRFCYRVFKRSPTLSDFQASIDYDTALLKMIKMRVKKKRLASSKAIINFQIKRIHNLFNAALSKFSSNVNLWESHLRFCSRMHNIGTFHEVLEKFLRFHMGKPESWELAINLSIEIGEFLLSNALINRSLDLFSHSLLLKYLRFKVKISEIIRDASLNDDSSKILVMIEELAEFCKNVSNDSSVSEVKSVFGKMIQFFQTLKPNYSESLMDELLSLCLKASSDSSHGESVFWLATSQALLDMSICNQSYSSKILDRIFQIFSSGTVSTGTVDILVKYLESSHGNSQNILSNLLSAAKTQIKTGKTIFSDSAMNDLMKIVFKNSQKLSCDEVRLAVQNYITLYPNSSHAIYFKLLHLYSFGIDDEFYLTCQTDLPKIHEETLRQEIINLWVHQVCKLAEPSDALKTCFNTISTIPHPYFLFGCAFCSLIQATLKNVCTFSVVFEPIKSFSLSASFDQSHLCTLSESYISSNLSDLDVERFVDNVFEKTLSSTIEVERTKSSAESWMAFVKYSYEKHKKAVKNPSNTLPNDQKLDTEHILSDLFHRATNSLKGDDVQNYINHFVYWKNNL